MWNVALGLLFKALTSKAAKIAISIAINKLLEHKDDGITKDIANTMIEGIIMSKSNPVKQGTVLTAIRMLKEDSE